MAIDYSGWSEEALLGSLERNEAMYRFLNTKGPYGEKGKKALSNFETRINMLKSAIEAKETE